MLTQTLAWPVVSPATPSMPFSRTARERRPPVALTPEVEDLLRRDAVVAIGVSGGKDSDAVALAVAAYLDQTGHRGPRVLIHSDLGRTEWQASLPSCERLAEHLGWELMVVRRTAGDMLARWQGRWTSNLARYETLSCVTLILPWSTPAMKFCQSELKVDVITRALRKRWPDQDIINVTGIRRQESSSRAKMPVSAPLGKLQRRAAAGISWNAIIEWKLDDVFGAIADAGLSLHEAYTVYGASRVSCAFCIMSAARDLAAGVSCEENQELYRSMVELEAASTFGFQGSRWLADVAPDLLSGELRERIVLAKRAALARVVAEKDIPKHLLFTAGWPTSMPTPAEAEVLASVRRRVAQAVGLQIGVTTGADVLERYKELMALRGTGSPADHDEDAPAQAGAIADLCGMQA
jgi:3'-phosphoadenosine 5'-phosphosulfate sulfotransferase (PAPS reductase)/FAD synthetase